MTDWTTCRMTPEMLAELRRLLDAPPQDITIVRDDALALLDAAAERDALAADADKWQRAALTLQRDRDALTDERDSLSWQAEAIRADELRRHEAGLDADLAYQAFAGEEALR